MNKISACLIFLVHFILIGNAGGCPRIENLLRKTPFGHFFRTFSLNRATIRLKCSKKLTQKGFPSLRFLFSDSLPALYDLLVVVPLTGAWEQNKWVANNQAFLNRIGAANEGYSWSILQIRIASSLTPTFH